MKFTNALVEKQLETSDLKIDEPQSVAFDFISSKSKYSIRFNKLFLFKKYWKIRPSYYPLTFTGLLHRMIIL